MGIASIYNSPMDRLSVKTHRKREILDITDQIEKLLGQKKNAVHGSLSPRGTAYDCRTDDCRSRSGD